MRDCEYNPFPDYHGARPPPIRTSKVPRRGVWRAAAASTGLQADMADAFFRRDETLSLAFTCGCMTSEPHSTRFEWAPGAFSEFSWCSGLGGRPARSTRHMFACLNAPNGPCTVTTAITIYSSTLADRGKQPPGGSRRKGSAAL
eukprot:scaffold127030_cov87-Phaeocystis_antarctica.AAC.1